MATTIRRIRPAESLELREVRLAALTDSPSAFGSTYAESVELPIAHWVDRAASGARGNLNAVFIAMNEGGWVGLGGGFRESVSDSSIELVSMWVAPQARRGGTGAALVRAVVQWALEIEAAEVQLWVTVGNNRAAELYRSEGFDTFDEFQPLPSDPCKDEVRMRRAL